MPKYNMIVCVQQTRSYTVAARNAEEAEEFLRAEFDYIDYDVIDTVLDEVTMEDS